MAASKLPESGSLLVSWQLQILPGMRRYGQRQLRSIGRALQRVGIGHKRVLHIAHAARHHKVRHGHAGVDERQTGGVDRRDQRAAVILQHLNINVDLASRVLAKQNHALKQPLHHERGGSAPAVALPRAASGGGGKHGGRKLALDNRPVVLKVARRRLARPVHRRQHARVSLLVVRRAVGARQRAQRAADLAHLVGQPAVDAQPVQRDVLQPAGAAAATALWRGGISSSGGAGRRSGCAARRSSRGARWGASRARAGEEADDGAAAAAAAATAAGHAFLGGRGGGG
ncbi:hypothetical protein FGB62_73g043 [Gracilaria domingensis]|nr:hypothetical protein FGB62_73g043 [Gracilaria domingensis]